MRTIEEFKESLLDKAKDDSWLELADKFLPDYLKEYAKAEDGLARQDGLSIIIA